MMTLEIWDWTKPLGWSYGQSYHIVMRTFIDVFFVTKKKHKFMWDKISRDL